jgi:hypothetical protein
MVKKHKRNTNDVTILSFFVSFMWLALGLSVRLGVFSKKLLGIPISQLISFVILGVITQNVLVDY